MDSIISDGQSKSEIIGVHRHPQAKADIVFVHGLNGSPETTWRAKANGVYWPKDLLPASLRDQHANILMYRYNSAVTEHGDNIPSKDRIDEHAETLVFKLTQYRKNEGTYRLPIIWVVHSLGGILTKCALLHSENLRGRNMEDLRSIYVSTYGIIFLGTPHNGSTVANWGRALHSTLKASLVGFFVETEGTLLKTLMKDSEMLRHINNRFLQIHQNFRIHMVHETLKTGPKGLGVKVVDNASAGPRLFGVTYYGIEATHSDMCKFESVHAPGYLTISTSIREWVADGPNVIPTRWAVEEEGRRQRATLEISERIQKYRRGTGISLQAEQQTIVEGNKELSMLQTTLTETTTTAAPALLMESPHSDQDQVVPEPAQSQGRDEDEPRFVHPEKFRPNSFFIGREDELRALHEMLMDRRRRSEGTSAVLIHCLPGGGKTHLARQYVFKHKDDYPGGVYWVRAKSRHDLESWFCRFAEDEGLGGLTNHKDVEELRDSRKIVQSVRKWLNARSGWLMVFDGVHFDMPDLHEFIPDARHTSLIFTSTEQAVVGDPRFDNPQALDLGLLTAEEARDLLLLEIDTVRKQSWTEEERAMALELVQLMGRLPLMIHIAAQHIKATREPLARYLKSYRSRPKAGGLSAYKAVLEQLRIRAEFPALNLISLLAFFDQHLPLEMLVMGLDALDPAIPVKTRDAAFGRSNLNNTLKVLIAFALIDRTDSSELSPTSSRSSKHSFDKYVDHLDLLRIHSVVQAFFIDSIRDIREIEYYLRPATDIWCRSYDKADKRIQEDPSVGLPDDYRRYSIHGQKLLQNVRRFESRYSLADARSRLEERLEQIQEKIDSLSQTIRKNIIEDPGREQPTSVFDRISSSSQSGSSAILISYDSQLSSDTSIGDEYYGRLVDSPLMVDWDIESEAPYPSIAVMPALPEGSDDDQETVVLSTSQATQTHLMTSTQIADFGPIPQERYIDYPQPDPYEGWQGAIPRHRVIERQESRRYRDRAGAWRDRTISDPRVGLTREVALGSVSSRRGASRSPVRARLTAQSEAEMELNKLKKLAAPSPLSPGPRGSFDSATSRPENPLGAVNVAQPETQATEPTTSFAQIFRSSVGSLKRVLSSRRLNDGAPVPVDAGARPQAQMPTEEEEVIVPPGSLFLGRGSRSDNNSPASQSSPFPAPSFSAIPTDELMGQPSLPASVQRWDTVAHYPTATLLGSSEPDAANPDPMSYSYPSLPSRPQPHPSNTHPTPQQPWLYAEPPAGYSSEPMSRNGSHQSNPSVKINSPSGAPIIYSPHTPLTRTPFGRNSVPLPVPITGGQPSSNSSPSNSAPTAAGPSNRLSPFTRPRRASYTETEPSPRLDTPFPDVDTSYQRWEQHHARGSIASPSTAAAPALVGGRTGSSSSSPRARAGRATRISRGRDSINGWNADSGRRAHSLSPSASPSPPVGRSRSGSGPGSVSPLPFPLPSASPRGGAGGSARVGGGGGGVRAQAQYQSQLLLQQQRHHHPLAAEWPVAATTTTDESVQVGGESMARSAAAGSSVTNGAGIRVGYGVVQFRSHSPEGRGGGRAGGGGSGSSPENFVAGGLGISDGGV
ncbi:Protein SERAC1 [Madurella mycetomatis]|uniref:Protein SERAC1 n=1 Tax=Madurella mycetomatis TaxID=100816 RepID=A0A175WFM8_9PEZI|nr:Protein SERAC1 [Madurella mycetomatis]